MSNKVKFVDTPNNNMIEQQNSFNPKLLGTRLVPVTEDVELSAEESYNRLKASVLKETESRKKIATGCPFHKKKPSSSCRKCKQVEQPKEEPKTVVLIKKLDLHGDSVSNNLNSLLINNILSSHYFKSTVMHLSFSQTVDEILNKAKHVEPWAGGGFLSRSQRAAVHFFLLSLQFNGPQTE